MPHARRPPLAADASLVVALGAALVVVACGVDGRTPGPDQPAAGGGDGGGTTPSPGPTSGGAGSVALALAWGGGSDDAISSARLELQDAVVFSGSDAPAIEEGAPCDRGAGTSAGLAAALALDLRAPGEAFLATLDVPEGDLRELRLLVRGAVVERHGRDHDARPGRRCRGEDGTELGVVSVRPDHAVRVAAGAPVTLVIRFDAREDVRVGHVACGAAVPADDRAGDDPPGDDHGGAGNDDPPGDDHGGAGNDDPPGDDRGGPGAGDRGGGDHGGGDHGGGGGGGGPGHGASVGDDAREACEHPDDDGDDGNPTTRLSFALADEWTCTAR